MRIIYLLMLVFSISGCAQKLEMTVSQNEILGKLGDDNAEHLTEKIFSKTDKHLGLTGTNQSGAAFKSKPEIVSIKNGIIKYVDYDEHVDLVKTIPKVLPNAIAGQSIVGAALTPPPEVLYNTTREEFEIDLREISKIRLVQLPPNVSLTNGQLITLHNAFEAITIDVAKDEIDETIALIKFYSPNAKVLSGAGL